MSGRIVIVSNRVALPGERSSGGLAVALRDVARRHGGIWFGWSGQITEASPAPPRFVTSGKLTYVTTDLTRSEYERYYLGYANGTLWPLLHYRLGLVDYSRQAFAGYCEVNARFARLLAPLLRPDDLVWVNDFHLIPIALALRELGVANRIGFFLHTPLPSADVLSALPQHDRLMRGLCAYDLVGFQTADALRAFLGYIAAVAGGRHREDGSYVAWGFRSRAARFPVGIDTPAFAALAEEATDAPEARRLRDSLSGRPLVLGVDRLDYSKGLPQRFAAIECLLDKHPEHRRRFSYLQIAPYSRTELAQYRMLRRELDGSAGRINGKFAECDWSPIRYINKSFSQRTLAGFYRIARVGLVTPLRDGMNLVAKEFVAAQDPADPGVLILSRFAGAAAELEAALLVNPIDVEDVAEALHRAMQMPRDERRQRWRAMIAVLRENTVARWRDDFLAALSRSDAPLHPPSETEAGRPHRPGDAGGARRDPVERESVADAVP